jgi:hypothetical protein
MSKKVKQINLERWLKKKKSWFLPGDFSVVSDFMSKLDNETLSKLCHKLKWNFGYRLESPAIMIFTAICTYDRMYLDGWWMFLLKEIGLWMWLAFAMMELPAPVWMITGIGALLFYLYDIVTVKKRTRKHNFKHFCKLTGCATTVSKTMENNLF